MNNDFKNTLKDIVEIFYQPPFKIFNINSVDGKTLVKPFGYFISLGITTSLDMLRNLRDIIAKSDYGFEARLVEIESTKSDFYGDFLNVLVDLQENEIKKYPSAIPEGTEILEKEDAEKLISKMTEKIESGEYAVSVDRQQLIKTFNKIDNWKDFAIQMRNGQPGVFHRYVNYRKAENSEFRIGIYVTKI